MDKPDTRWEFVRLHSAYKSWIWRCVRADGTTSSSGPEGSGTFGKTMVDAVRHGFRSETQRWRVKDRDWTTDFAPGKEPKTTRRDPTRMSGAPKPFEDYGRSSMRSFTFLSLSEFQGLTLEEQCAYIGAATAELERTEVDRAADGWHRLFRQEGAHEGASRATTRDEFDAAIREGM